MESSELTPIVITLASITAGAFLGALGNKLVTHNSKTKWKWGFYSLSILSLLFAINVLFFAEELSSVDYFGLLVLIISSLALSVFTYKFLDKKFIFKTVELDPIVNEWTDLSDHNDIKLFGGDLNFFGNTPSKMDRNNQYTFLKSLSFKKVAILCEVPTSTTTKIRYGKILKEMSTVELRFYNPDEADLLIRGRLKTFQGVEKLLIYQKIDSGLYQTIETDTANSNGALYNNIWKLVWSLATVPSEAQKQGFINTYDNK